MSNFKSELDEIVKLSPEEAIESLKSKNIDLLCATVYHYHKINLATKSFVDQFKTTTESHYERYRNLLNPLVNHLETTRTTNRNAVMELAKTKVSQHGITDAYANESKRENFRVNDE